MSFIINKINGGVMTKIRGKAKQILTRELKREEIINIILYSIIFIMPFIVNGWEKPVYVTGKVYFLFVCTILILFFGLKKEKVQIRVEHKISLIFLITILISVLFSPFKDIAFWGSFNRYEGFIMYLVYIILFIFSTKYLVLSKTMLSKMLIVADIMAIYGVFQFYGLDPIQKLALGEIKVVSSMGMIGNQNFFSTYLCIFLFISMALFVLNGENKYLLFSIPLFTALLCTLTRSGWLAFIIYSVIGLPFIIKRIDCLKRALVIFVVFIFCFVTLNTMTNKKIINRANKSNIVSEEGEFTGSAGARVEILKLSWKAFASTPLLGTGPDTLAERLNRDISEEHLNYILKYNSTIDKAHNEYLELAVSCGIFTLISYLILIFLIIKGLINNISDDRNKVLLLTLIGYLVQAFFNISVIMVAPLFWIFLGYCVKVNYEGFINY